MSLSDCIKCWDTPCSCGWDYKEWPVERLKEQIAMLQKVLDSKMEVPHPPKDDHKTLKPIDELIEKYDEDTRIIKQFKKLLNDQGGVQ